MALLKLCSAYAMLTFLLELWACSRLNWASLFFVIILQRRHRLEFALGRLTSIVTSCHAGIFLSRLLFKYHMFGTRIISLLILIFCYYNYLQANLDEFKIMGSPLWVSLIYLYVLTNSILTLIAEHFYRIHLCQAHENSINNNKVLSHYVGLATWIILSHKALLITNSLCLVIPLRSAFAIK